MAINTDPKHPRLSPLRALALLRRVEKARGSNELYEKNNTLEEVASQLEQHVSAELVKRRRR